MSRDELKKIQKIGPYRLGLMVHAGFLILGIVLQFFWMEKILHPVSTSSRILDSSPILLMLEGILGNFAFTIPRIFASLLLGVEALLVIQLLKSISEDRPIDETSFRRLYIFLISIAAICLFGSIMGVVARFIGIRAN